MKKRVEVTILPSKSATVNLEGPASFRVINVPPNVVVKGFARDFSNNGRPMDSMRFTDVESEVKHDHERN